MERISTEHRLTELLEPRGGSEWAADGVMHYSLVGEPRRGTVLLVAGLAMQRTDWCPELLSGLHAAGYQTLAADNRDAGKTRLYEPHSAEVAPDSYTLEDLALDLRLLLEHLSLGPVHVLGMSMGGMIAQHLALHHPDRVATLISVMSTTGGRAVGRPQEASKWIFLQQPPLDSREAYAEYAVRYHRALAGERYADVERARWAAEVAWERGVNPEGTSRQLSAIQRDGDRSERLRSLRVPTLVVHGDADPVIGLSGGIATAAAIPGATLHRVPGMGHSIPWQLAGSLAQRVADFIEC